MSNDPIASSRQAYSIAEAMRHFSDTVLAISNADDTMTVYHGDHVEAALAPLGMTLRGVSGSVAVAVEYARRRKVRAKA